MSGKDICECGHPRSCHADGIAGCFYNGDESSTIINFDDVDCDCNEFVEEVVSEPEVKK